jgi:Right handed beta helix region
MSTRQRAVRCGIVAVPLFLLLPVLTQAATLEISSSQSLFDVMAGTSPGDILVLACGTYQEEAILVTPGVTLRSVSGQAGCVILETSGQQPILIFQEASAATRVEGLIFTRAADDASAAIARGGAVLCDASSPVFVGCEFNGLAAAYGGAVFCGAGSSPEFRECVFQGNEAFAVGGAIACVDGSSPVLEECLLAGNIAGGAGGAINAAVRSHPILRNCTLAQNQGEAASGVAGWEDSAAVLEQVIVAQGLSGAACRGDAASMAAISCSNLFENEGGDWTGILTDQVAVDGNLSVDPQFCSGVGTGDFYSLFIASPCAAENSACGQIGAFPVGCHEASPVPDDLPIASRLQGNYPNPFNPRTKILFDVGRSGQVELAIYDVAGRLVRRLVNEPMIRGSHEMIWEGDDSGSRPVAAGVYFLRLKTADTVSRQRITLIK